MESNQIEQNSSSSSDEEEQEKAIDAKIQKLMLEVAMIIKKNSLSGIDYILTSALFWC